MFKPQATLLSLAKQCHHAHAFQSQRSHMADTKKQELKLCCSCIHLGQKCCHTVIMPDTLQPRVWDCCLDCLSLHVAAALNSVVLNSTIFTSHSHNKNTPVQEKMRQQQTSWWMATPMRASAQCNRHVLCLELFLSRSMTNSSVAVLLEVECSH